MSVKYDSDIRFRWKTSFIFQLSNSHCSIHSSNVDYLCSHFYKLVS